jgi:hypothetical protein
MKLTEAQLLKLKLANAELAVAEEQFKNADLRSVIARMEVEREIGVDLRDAVVSTDGEITLKVTADV